jgi:DNA primase
LERGIFQCFGCKAKGNVLEFAALMEKVDPENGVELRTVAVKLQKHFYPDGLAKSARSEASPPRADEKPKELQLDPPQKVNARIDFKLKGLESDHEYLRGRGFSPKLLAELDVGFCSRGLFKDRIAIAVHNVTGDLVGYVGRTVNDRAVNPQNPKYLLPGRREREGVALEFDPSLLLYNAHRVGTGLAMLIVVPGIPATWWLIQQGLVPVVTTMGYSMSRFQADEVIARTRENGKVVLLSDGGPEGTRFASAALKLLAPARLVRWAKLPDGRRITDVPGMDIRKQVGL